MIVELQRDIKTGKFINSEDRFNYVKEDIETCGVYKITNLINYKIYVGSTCTSFKSRWQKHLQAINKNNHPNQYLQNSYNKHGFNNFKFEILQNVKKDKELIVRVEQFYLDTLKPEYNLLLIAGGGGNPTKSENECLEIINYYLNDKNISQGNLSEKYSLSRQTIRKILNGKYYSCRNLNKNLFSQCKRHAQYSIVKSLKDENMNIRALTKEQAIEIYNTYSTSTVKSKRKHFAKKYNTNESTIGDIASGRTYNDWTGAPEYLKKNLIRSKKS